MKLNKYFLLLTILLFQIVFALPLFSEDASSDLNDEDLPTLGPISSTVFNELTCTLEEILEQNSDIGSLYWGYRNDGNFQEGHVDMQVSLNIWATGVLRQKIASWYIELEYDPLSWDIFDFHMGYSDYDPFYPDELPEEYYLDMLKAAELEELIDKSWYEILVDLLNIKNGITSENGFTMITNFANVKIYSGYGDGGGSSGFSYELFKE